MFAAEQTWPTEAELKSKRKMSLDEEMVNPNEEVDMSQVVGSFKVSKDNLTELFDKLQIAVVGRDDGKESEGVISDSNESDIGEDDLNDENLVSQKHAKHTDMEKRAAEDMDFPDEVDTPFKDARVRF